MKNKTLEKGANHPLAQNSDDENLNAYPNAVDTTFNHESDFEKPTPDLKHKFTFKSSKKAQKDVG